jgi:hypothetical protein
MVPLTTLFFESNIVISQPILTNKPIVDLLKQVLAHFNLLILHKFKMESKSRWRLKH